MTTDPNPNPNPNRREDQRADAGADSDVTRAFWGDGTDWSTQSAESDEVATPRRGIGATVGRWWGSTTSTRRGATRTHAQAPSPTSHETDDGFAPVDDDHDRDDPDTDWNDAWETAPPDPPRSGVDPLLARLGGLAVVFTVMVPVVMGFTSDDGEAVRTAPIDFSTAASGGQPAEQPFATESTPATSIVPVADATPPVADIADALEPATVAPVTEAPIAAPSTAEVEALTECALQYEVAVGDFWIRIADGSGAALADVLAVNEATVSTPLYPGRSICLPDGAATPSPPPASTTAAPATSGTSSARSSSASSNNSTARTTPATTTPAPAPTPAPTPPASTAGPGEVEAIIRSVWPDDLEQRALEIARRESNFNPLAKNSCCYGVFQVYWSVHRGWLSGLGITSADQLYDPATNARAALALYERAGGWGPWGG